MILREDAAEGAILDQARGVAASVLAPRANAVDESDRVPHDNMRALADARLLGLAVPEAHGGHGAAQRVVRRFHGILAEACGTTAFVAIQHATACALVARSPSDAVRARLLPRMARGDLLGSPAFSHLRRPGPPAVTVTEEGNDLVFDGVAPWISGWGLIGVVALGGTLPDGRFAYAAVVLDETTGVSAWPPMRLAAMTASSTVSLTLSRARVPKERLLLVQTPDEGRAADAAGTLNQAPCSLGAAAAAARLLDARAADDPGITQFSHALRHEIDGCWRDVEAWTARQDDPAFAESALAVRAHCVDLGVRAAFSAIVATGGSALKRDRDAQRIYREAMLYGVAPQTTALRKATLTRLLGGH
jgi:alkylation response protein AidB-like acyl-CoA dehydrogenase